MSARPDACVICGSREGLRPVLRLHPRTLERLVPEQQECDAAGNRLWFCSSPTGECIRRGAERQRRLAEVAEIKRGPRRGRRERRGRKCPTCKGRGYPLRVRAQGGSGPATYSRLKCGRCGGTGIARRARP